MSILGANVLRSLVFHHQPVTKISRMLLAELLENLFNVPQWFYFLWKTTSDKNIFENRRSHSDMDMQKWNFYYMFYIHVIWSFIFVIYSIFMLYLLLYICCIFICIFHAIQFSYTFLFSQNLILNLCDNVFIFIICTKLVCCKILMITKIFVF